MGYDTRNGEGRPWWLAVVIGVLMLPLLLYPSILSQAPDGSVVRMLVWLYPAYVIATGICAWMCWPQRKEVTWVLLALLVLSHIGMWIISNESLTI